MRNKKQKFFFFFLFFVFFIFWANFTLAIEPRPPEINYPSLPFPGVDSPQVLLEKIQKGEIPGEQALPLYIKYFYYLSLMIAGLLALGVIVYGGLLYLISAGAPVKMISAKEQITGGILGLVILLSSYLILATINPQLAIFRLPGLEKVAFPEIEPPPLAEEKVPTYFQVPTGIIIENAALNKEAQEKLDYAYQTAEAAAESANELYALSEEIYSLVAETDCGASKCSRSCSATGCKGKDNQFQIKTAIGKTPQVIANLEKEIKEIPNAKISLLNDLFQLEAAGLLMSSASGVISYNTLLAIRHFQELETTAPPDWENIDIEIDGRIVKGPITFYFNEEGNEDIIYLASVLRWGGDAGFPPEPIGGWPESPPAEPGKLGWPLPLARLSCSSDFGACRPVGGACERPHLGLDFSTPIGTPVYAVADGTVIFAGQIGGYNGGYGNVIIITHEKLELSTLYAHLNGYSVKRGDRVVAGQIIATSGSTGYSTGSHLHFEVRNGSSAENFSDYKNTKPLDPKDFLPSEPSIKEDCYNNTTGYFPGYPK